MSALISISIDLNKIDKSKIIQGDKGKYYNLTLSVNDETDQYGNNVSVFDKQTKEQVTAKDKKDYLGSGQVFWENGTIKKCTGKKDSGQPDLSDLPESDLLPF